MILRSITFADTDDPDTMALPQTVTVTMTIAEAALVLRMVGKLTDPASEAIVPVAGGAHHDIHSCLAGDVFNRYWDDGVHDYRPPG